MLHHKKKACNPLCSFTSFPREEEGRNKSLGSLRDALCLKASVALTETDFSRINIYTDCYLLNKAVEREIKGITVCNGQSHGGAARRQNPGKSPEMGQIRM